MKYGKVDLGQIEAVLNKIGGEKAIPLLLAGELLVVPKPHHIPNGPNLFTPSGWKVKSHLETGTIEWYAMLERLESLNLAELKTSLRNFTAAGSGGLGVHVLEYLLARQWLIPEQWKKWRTYFAGTVFSHSSGKEGILYLEYREIDDDDYRWHYDIISPGATHWVPNKDVVLVYKG